MQDVTSRILNPRQLAERIREGRLRKGWSVDRLAREAHISRTTLHHLEHAQTAQPQYKTLQSLAGALEMSSEDLFRTNRRRQFDRATNCNIEGVHRDHPQVFANWRVDEWDELYSTFGVGGSLSEEGVLVSAQQINQKRELIRKLHVVLETHLKDSATDYIESLYGMVCIEGTLAAEEQTTPPTIAEGLKRDN